MKKNHQEIPDLSFLDRLDGLGVTGIFGCNLGLELSPETQERINEAKFKYFGPKSAAGKQIVEAFVNNHAVTIKPHPTQPEKTIIWASIECQQHYIPANPKRKK